MRFAPSVVVLGILVAFGSASEARSQAVERPTIQSVTLQPDAGVLTVKGKGLGADLVVIVDGQAVTVLPGATPTQLEVQAPATVLTTAGTFRLTVTDPVRRVVDTFVVANQPVPVAVGGAALTARPSGAPVAMTSTRVTTERVIGMAADPGVSPAVIENSCNTAVGLDALINNSTGCGNTATGFTALGTNTTGTVNTAVGNQALFRNSSGKENTAIGNAALGSNTGDRNTASGAYALVFNTTGTSNTASGMAALLSNTTGNFNTASGTSAMEFNSTGYENTATGYQALRGNSMGFWNTASGAGALRANTDGYQNTATGFNALGSNTEGIYNTASGFAALYLNTTGFANAAYGIGAMYGNTTGFENAALGHDAGYNATTGSSNVFLGANVKGTAADTNTIRLGLPYDGAIGQNKTFIAGIYGTPLTGSVFQVFVDANGQLGTLTPPVKLSGSETISVSQLQQQLGAQQEQLQEQQATMAELRARLAKLEALLARPAARR